jgi:hypothetical protein
MCSVALGSSRGGFLSNAAPYNYVLCERDPSVLFSTSNITQIVLIRRRRRHRPARSIIIQYMLHSIHTPVLPVPDIPYPCHVAHRDHSSPDPHS